MSKRKRHSSSFVCVRDSLREQLIGYLASKRRFGSMVILYLVMDAVAFASKELGIDPERLLVALYRERTRRR